MKNGNLRIALGVLLILLQLVSILGMIVAQEPLWNEPADEEYYKYYYVDNTAAPGEMVLGFYAGYLKSAYAIQYLPRAILNANGFPRNYTIEYSTALWVALYNSDGAFSAVRVWLLDLSIFMGFTFFATVGFFLLISGIFAKVRWHSKPRKDYYVDKPLPVVNILLLLGSLFFIGSYMLWDLQYLNWEYFSVYLNYANFFMGLLQLDAYLLSTITVYDVAMVVIFLALVAFFLFRQGKKPSVLPAFALLLYSAQALLGATSSITSLLMGSYSDGFNFEILLPLCLSCIFGLLPCVFLLVAGLILYFSGKKILPGVLVVGALGFNLINFVLLFIDCITRLNYIAPGDIIWPSFAGILFAFVMAVYLFLPVARPEKKKEKKPLREKKTAAGSAEPTAPTLITTVPTEPQAAPVTPAEQEDAPEAAPSLITPVTTDPQPAPADKPLFCGMCGKALTPGHSFCRYCGAKLD